MQQGQPPVQGQQTTASQAPPYSQPTMTGQAPPFEGQQTMTGQAPEAQYQSYNPQQYANAPMGQQIPPAGVQHNQSYDLPPLPPRQSAIMDPADDPSHPVHYTRDPHRLVAYLVPFPRPQVKGAAPDSVPMRFLIYTCLLYTSPSPRDS